MASPVLFNTVIYLCCPDVLGCGESSADCDSVSTFLQTAGREPTLCRLCVEDSVDADGQAAGRELTLCRLCVEDSVNADGQAAGRELTLCRLCVEDSVDADVLLLSVLVGSDT